jgi:hypothetical protein
MSWATCYSGSNNIYFNSPPLMSDSRNFSSWQPDAVVNEKIQEKEQIKTNWEYRQFLQQHGMQIMSYNNQESCYALGLDPRVTSGKTPSSNVPYRFKGIFDTSQPGFGYCNSDLKNPYLSREQLNSRLVAPTINPSNYK